MVERKSRTTAASRFKKKAVIILFCEKTVIASRREHHDGGTNAGVGPSYNRRWRLSWGRGALSTAAGVLGFTKEATNLRVRGAADEKVKSVRCG